MASAAIVADYTNSYTIDEVMAGGGLVVGDKLFDSFRVTTTSTQGTIAPGSDAIKVTGVIVEGDYGLRFNGPWSAAAGQLADSTIKFRVSITEPYLSQGHLIKDNGLFMTAFGASPTLDNGMVSISENVYATDPDAGFNQPVANKLVYYISDQNNDLFDEKDFYDFVQGQPVALPEIWVVKDVVANGGLPDGVGVAHVSEFFQTFSQVPEPTTIGLLCLGSTFIFAKQKLKKT